MGLIKTTSEGCLASAKEMDQTWGLVDGIIKGMIDIADDMPYYAVSASTFRKAIDDWVANAGTIMSDLGAMAEKLRTVGNNADITEITNQSLGTFF
jgi:hypothetical protein